MNAVVRVEAPPGGSVFAHMAQLLDVKLESETDAVRLVARGVSARSYRRLASRLKLPVGLVAPETTVRRRLKANARFTAAESERIVRLARIHAEAVELFGDPMQALDWLNTAQAYVPGQPPVNPLQLAAGDSGARLVEAQLRRTAHGIF